jgi:glutamate-1-semialdehyde 2,1-aminomutase
MPDSLGVPEETAKNTIVVPYNDAEAFEATVKKERKELAAVIVEPVIGNIGVVTPKKGYLHLLRELTEQLDLVLIFDEVITGFRMALGGAQEYYGVKPDLTTLGKVLGGGFPMAAYAGREEIMQMIAPSGRVYQAGTYSGNPVSVAAGLTTLKILRGRKRFYAKLEENCENLVKSLENLVKESGVPVQINHVASMFQMFLTSEPVYDYSSAKKADSKKFLELHKRLLGQGVFVPPSQFETCFLSSAHTARDIERTVQGFGRALQSQSTTC